MKTRLGLFISALLILPFLGMLLSGNHWSEWDSHGDTPAELTPLMLTLLVVSAYTWAVNFALTLRSGNNPFKAQRDFYLAIALSGLALGWLLTYLNLYVASWFANGALDAAHIVLQSTLFAMLAPAVFLTRALIGSFGGLLKSMTRTVVLPAVQRDTTTYLIAPLALLGLLGATAWSAQLFWLVWLSPLLLLLTLQLLWNESTIFSGLSSGDWSRIILGSVAGILVGNIALLTFKLTGGAIVMQLPSSLFVQLGFAIYGLLCLQLGDIVAEIWRGKTRAQIFKKKTFPIPVVVKK